MRHFARNSFVSRVINRLAVVATVGLVMSMAACDDDDPTGPASAAGAYLLATIEQQGFAECTLGATGCTINDTGTEVIVVEDATLTLNSNGSWTLVANGTRDAVDEQLATIGGTWVRTQTGVTLTVTGVTTPITGTFTTSAEDEMEFVVPGSFFDSTVGSMTLTFDRT